MSESSIVPIQPHYESTITFDTDPATGETRVTKAYRQDTLYPGAEALLGQGNLDLSNQYNQGFECIRWLNSILAQYYDPNAGLPVAQHEFAAYRLLEPFGFVPRPLELGADSITVGFGGESLSADSDISEDAYERQSLAILRTFEQIGFRHNDMVRPNVLISNGRIRIIDFTVAEFGGISLMPALPDPSWARAGQDARLINLFREAHEEAVMAGREQGGLIARVRRAFRLRHRL